MKKKLLIIGGNPLTFLRKVASSSAINCDVTVLSLFKHPLVDEVKEDTFHTVLASQAPSKKRKLILFFKQIPFHLFPIIFDIFRFKISSPRDIIDYTINFPLIRSLSNYDIINLQQVSLKKYWLNYISQETKVIVSFWGSDILRKEKKNLFFDKVEWIKRADTITTSSNKMRIIFESKYGTEYMDKLFHILYLPKLNLYKKIDALKLTTNNSQITIAIGYNGSQSHNHLKIISQLNKLETLHKEKLKLLLFFQYGAIQEYKNLVVKTVKANRFSYEIIEHKLSIEELAEKRKASDIFILLPISDAFSASVSETLYAGNIMICGSWLPYSRYKENGVYYETIDSFDELPAKLEYVLKNQTELKKKAELNKDKVMKTLNYQSNLEKWVELLTTK